MFNLPSIRLGRLFGIPLEVNVTWFVIFVLVAFSLSFSYFPTEFGGRSTAVNVVSGIVTTLLFFASVVLHEFSHSLVARRGGIRINRITLFVFGGVAQMEEEPTTPKGEFVMAIAGPAMSVALALFFFGIFLTLSNAGVSNVWWGPVRYLAEINLLVAVFNLLPGFPLDGGRVFRAGLWAIAGDQLKATRWASRTGQGLGLVMISVAVLGVLAGTLDLIWFALLGWFITGLAGSAYRQQVVKSKLSSVPVSAVMSSPAATAPGEITLQEMIDRHFLGGHHTRYPVVVAGRLAGLLSLSHAKAVPRERWPQVTVVEAAEKDIDGLLVDASAPLDQVLGRLGPDSPGALLVVDEGGLAGIVTRADVLRALRVAELG